MNKALPALILFLLLLNACSPAPAAPANPSPTQPPPTATHSPPTPAPPTPSPSPSDSLPAADPHFPAEAVEYAIQLVEQRKVPGIAIGLLTPEGMFYFNYGASTWDSDQAIDEHTLFEIGSITKVFSAILLAHAVEQGLTTLDTPLGELVPEEVSMPAHVDQPVTLKHLVTQRSGLPRMPTNFTPQSTFNPYRDYPRDLMYEFIDGYKLLRPPGSVYEYSNLGFMLLGDLLEGVYEKPYEEIVVEVIASPLEMEDTRTTLSEEQAARFARGHSGEYPVASWDFALPGAGALRSTTTDMLRFLQAYLQPGEDALGAAMRLTTQECYETDTYFIEVCLGIHTYTRYGKTLYWHNGQTGGYHSFAGFAPDDGVGVVVLVNSNYNIDELALHLLEAQSPLPPLP